MANRKTRNERYQATVRGTIGGLDVSTASENADYVINKQGAKVYKDVTKHSLLEIPAIHNTNESGVVHKVLSAGLMGSTPTVTLKIGDLPQVFRLPGDYVGWVQTVMGLSLSGYNPFPAEVEFGRHANGKHYAEVL